MSLNLDAVIEAPDDSVDMKAGLDTFQGVSDAVRCIAETVLTDKVPKHKTHKGKVRTTLKQSFRGSYGLIFSVDIYDDNIKKKFTRIGREAFAELISYYLNDSIYEETRPLSDKAQKIVDKLGDQSDNLTKQIRTSALDNIHKISTTFDYDLKVRFRKNRDDQTTLARFNKSTAEVLEAKESDERLEVIAAITRLNINTGNGRLLISGTKDTVAFGFETEYKDVKIGAKKIFSENLDNNNGLTQDKWSYLKLVVSPITLRDGKIIKYIIKAFYNAE